MRAILVQKDVNNPDYAGFLKDVDSQKTDLVCFGELATSGCLYTPRQVPKIDSVIQNFNGKPYAIMIGFPLVAPEGIYNSFMYYQNGQYQLYKKINLFPLMNEDKVFQPGENPGIFETPFGKIGAAICYDIRFPEVFSNLKKLGAKIIFVPAAFPLVRINDWKNLLIQRATDNHVTLVGVNAVGDDGTNVFGGTTMVVDEKGNILHEADNKTEQVIEVEL